MKMPNMCPLRKGTFWPGFGRNWDPFLKKCNNGTLQMKVFGPKKFEIPCIEWCEISIEEFFLKRFLSNSPQYHLPISYCLLMKDESFCIKNASHFASVLCMMISFLFLFFPCSLCIWMNWIESKFVNIFNIREKQDLHITSSYLKFR